jgi:hypothetical protein
MASQTVTASIETTCHYWFTPQAVISDTGVTVAEIVNGWVAGTEASPTTLSLTLDDSFVWDVALDMENAAPVRFEGLSVTGGGELFELLRVAGWTPL